jgi:hypothetical protein
VTYDIRLATGSFHFMERPQLGGVRCQLFLYVGPLQASMSRQVLFEASLQGGEEFFTLLLLQALGVYWHGDLSGLCRDRYWAMLHVTASPGGKMRTLVVLMGCMAALGVQAADSPALQGTYKYAPEQSESISKAIDQAVEKMNFIKRPIARSRLTRTNTPYQQIRIDVAASEVEIAFDAQPPIRMPINEQPIKWTRADGEVFDVSAKAAGDKLLQTYQAADGRRVNSFYKDAAGSLHLAVEVSSPQLPRPVKYSLVYRPAS